MNVVELNWKILQSGLYKSTCLALYKMFFKILNGATENPVPLGTGVSSTSSFDLHLVELSTNVKSSPKFTMSFDLGSNLGEKNMKFPYFDDFFKMQFSFPCSFNVIT